MQDKISLPTDNIYKFFALFGLVILLFSIGALIYNTTKTNTQIIDTAIQLDSANSNNLSDQTKKAIKIHRDIIISDRDGAKILLTISAMFGILLGMFGFYKWVLVIQPRQDKLICLQIQIANNEIASFNKSMEIMELQKERELLEIKKIKKDLE